VEAVCTNTPYRNHGDGSVQIRCIGTMPKIVDHDQRRQELRDALWRLVDRGELAPVTIRELAAEAGVSVGLVQHYFPTKEELLLFAQRELQEDFDERFERRVRGLASPSIEVLKIFLYERLPLSSRQRRRGRVLLAWLTQVAWGPDNDGEVAAGQRQAVKALAGALRLGQFEGRVPSELDPENAGYGLFALSEGLCAGLLNGLLSPATAVRVLEEQLRLIIPGDYTLLFDRQGRSQRHRRQ
jgi:TetR/AcrR family transcriptional repressor of bet genes